jgi:hypothetical protein
VSEREEKRAAETWDREGVRVHLAVVHRERESRWSGLGMRVGSSLLRRKYILNIENYFPFNEEQKIIQKK